MVIDNSLKNPFDKIFMNEHASLWYNKGRKQAQKEAKLQHSKPKLTIDQNRMLYKIEEQQKEILKLKRFLADVIKSRDNFDRLLAKEMDKVKVGRKQSRLATLEEVLKWHKQMLNNWGPNKALKLSIKRLEQKIKEMEK